MKIIVINGSGGVGKDEFVILFRQICNETVASYSSVDVIKNAARKLGWNEKKSAEDRKFLSDLKDLSTKYNDWPLKCILDRIEDVENKVDYLFIHIREPDEIRKLIDHSVKKIHTLLIERDSCKKTYGNHADDNVKNFKYDFIIQNNGSIDDLKKEAGKFIIDLNFKETESDVCDRHGIEEVKWV